MRHNFEQRSREQAERSITRNQNDFAFGVYNDIPSSEIPERGVYYLNNLQNLGFSVQTRSGTRNWGNYKTSEASVQFPNIADGISLSSVISGQGRRTWTSTSDNTFSVLDIGNFIVRQLDGKTVSEEILVYVDDKTVTTRTSTSDTGETEVVSIGGPLNGWLYSDVWDRVIALVGDVVFVSKDRYMTEWYKAQFIGIPNGLDSLTTTAPTNAISTFEEYNNAIYFFNSGGIYKVEMSSYPYCFYKVNTSCPKRKIGDTGNLSTEPELPDGTEQYLYGRKRSYTISRLSGEGERDHRSPNVTIEWESGGVIVDETQDRDYGVSWEYPKANYPADPDDGSRAFPRVPTVPYGSILAEEDSIHATHLTVYGSLNIHPEYGISRSGNEPELLIFEEDIPVVTVVNISVGAFLRSTPFIDYYELGSGGEDVPDNIATSNGFASVDGETVVVGIDKDAGEMSFTKTTGINVGDVLAISFGSDIPIKATKLGSNITIDLVGSEKDITELLQYGMPIYWSDGSIDYIKEYISNTEIVIWEGTTQPSGKLSGALFSPRELKVTPSVSDADLKVRSEVRFMQSRFWTPVENSDLGVISGGFCFFARSNTEIVKYTQLSQKFEYFIGYHNEPLQNIAITNDVVKELRGFDNLVAIRCSGSTKAVSSSDYTSNEYANSRYVFVVNNINETSKTIGSSGVGSSAKIFGTNSEWVITSEPALRMFDGINYGENVLDNKLMNKLLELQNSYSTWHDPNWGLIWWGRT